MQLHALFWSLFMVSKLLVEIKPIIQSPERLTKLIGYFAADAFLVYSVVLFVIPLFNRKKILIRKLFSGILLLVFFISVNILVSHLVNYGLSKFYLIERRLFYSISRALMLCILSVLIYVYYFQKSRTYLSLLSAKRSAQIELQFLTRNNYLEPIPDLINRIGSGITSHQIPELAEYLRLTFNQKETIELDVSKSLTNKIMRFFESQITLITSSSHLDHLLLKRPLDLIRIAMLVGLKHSGNVELIVENPHHIQLESNAAFDFPLINALDEFSRFNNITLELKEGRRKIELFMLK